MSNLYPDLNNTNFPEEVDSYDLFLDPTLDTLSLINQYYNLFDMGDLDGCATLLSNNPILKQMIINAGSLNKLRDSIIATQRFYLDNVQPYLQDIVKYKGMYNPSAKYVKYNVVYLTANNTTQFYMCIDKDTPIGTLPTDVSFWVVLTLWGPQGEKGEKGEQGDTATIQIGNVTKGEEASVINSGTSSVGVFDFVLPKGDRGLQGVSGTGLAYQGAWFSSVQYQKNDCVAHNNMLWAANDDNAGYEPNDVSLYWSAVIDIYKQTLLSETQPANQAVGDMWYEVV